MVSDFTWAEDLPPDCPPSDAELPNGKRLHRYVIQFPPKESDFYSQRKLKPLLPIADECIGRAVSLFEDIKVLKQVMKLPLQKDGGCVVEIDLPNGSGIIKRTGRRSHYSWWRCKDYDPIGDCKLVDDGAN